jgi:hypothetical protein
VADVEDTAEEQWHAAADRLRTGSTSMSAIPPTWLGSIIQTQGAEARAAGDKQAESAAESERAGGTFTDKLQDVIEKGDRDSQVYADAEGSGSQGRPSEEAEERPPDEPAAEEPGSALDLRA